MPLARNLLLQNGSRGDRSEMLRTAAALACLLAMPAQALLVTFDPADYAPGTNLHDAHDGVTVNRITISRPFPPPAPWIISTSDNVPNVTCESAYGDCDGIGLGFGTASIVENYLPCTNNPLSLACGSASLLEFVFDTPTDLASIAFTRRPDSPRMLAFDTTGVLVANCYFNPNASGECTGTGTSALVGGAGTIQIQLDSARISRVVVGVEQGNGFFHRVTYNVPEPGTLALFGIGLLGALVGRRRSAE